VVFVSYGRESGGLHAVAQLRQVFAELHAVTLQGTISLPCYWELFDADGRLAEGDRRLQRHDHDHARPARLVGPRAHGGAGARAVPGVTATRTPSATPPTRKPKDPKGTL